MPNRLSCSREFVDAPDDVQRVRQWKRTKSQVNAILECDARDTSVQLRCAAQQPLQRRDRSFLEIGERVHDDNDVSSAARHKALDLRKQHRVKRFAPASMTRDKREVMLCHRGSIVRQTSEYSISHAV